MEFEGRTAVVTGGGSGIGRGLAITWAKEAMKVVVADIRLAAAEAVTKEIQDLGGQAEAVQCDVADPDSVQALADRSIDLFGTVDLLCNNAGVSMRGQIASATLKEWNWILSVNLFGIIHAINAFVPRMRSQPRKGHILNTSSGVSVINGDFGPIGLYIASKAAATALTERLRLELEPEGIGVSLLLPSRVDTAIHETSIQTRPAALGPVTAEGAVVQTDDINRLAAMDPLAVGEIVRDALQADLFYIHTDHAVRPGLLDRYADLLEAFAFVM